MTGDSGIGTKRDTQLVDEHPRATIVSSGEAPRRLERDRYHGAQPNLVSPSLRLDPAGRGLACDSGAPRRSRRSMRQAGGTLVIGRVPLGISP